MDEKAILSLMLPKVCLAALDTHADAGRTQAELYYKTSDTILAHLLLLGMLDTAIVASAI